MFGISFVMKMLLQKPPFIRPPPRKKFFDKCKHEAEAAKLLKNHCDGLLKKPGRICPGPQ